MFEAFNEITDDDAESYQVCGCLHSFLACLFFVVFDISAVVMTAGVYYLVSIEIGWTRDVTVPVGALSLSFFFFFLGPIGLIAQEAWYLTLYNIRLLIIISFTLGWTIYSFLVYEHRNMFVACIWFFASLLYIWGFFVTSRAITYFSEHYRGYYDVDLLRMEEINEKLNEKLEELKQLEMDGKDIYSNKNSLKTNDLKDASVMDPMIRSNMRQSKVISNNYTTLY